MNLGSLSDVILLLSVFDEDYLRAVLINAKAGWFEQESWTYWHYKLHITAIGQQVPPLPQRIIK